MTQTLFRRDVSLLSLNTFGFDVVAPYYAEFSDVLGLHTLISECRSRGLSWYVLGGGSNILFRGDFAGVVLRSVGSVVEQISESMVVADAGVVWDDLIRSTVSMGLCGLENLSYIPGTVGACPVQNIGAYGAQAGDFIEWVEYFDTDSMSVVRLSGGECEFGYRESVFKGRLRGRAVILRVCFRLSADFVPSLDYGDLRSVAQGRCGGDLSQLTPLQLCESVTEIRRSKLPEPSELGNAGSFFKNPVVGVDVLERLRVDYPEITSYPVDEKRVKLPAGWLIDTAGLRGYRSGAVGVHERQALVLVNYGGGTADDVLALARYVVQTVEGRFGVELQMEVNVL